MFIIYDFYYLKIVGYMIHNACLRHRHYTKCECICAAGNIAFGVAFAGYAVGYFGNGYFIRAVIAKTNAE